MDSIRSHTRSAFRSISSSLQRPLFTKSANFIGSVALTTLGTISLAKASIESTKGFIELVKRARYLQSPLITGATFNNFKQISSPLSFTSGWIVIAFWSVKFIMLFGKHAIDTVKGRSTRGIATITAERARELGLNVPTSTTSNNRALLSGSEIQPAFLQIQTKLQPVKNLCQNLDTADISTDAGKDLLLRTRKEMSELCGEICHLVTSIHMLENSFGNILRQAASEANILNELRAIASDFCVDELEVLGKKSYEYTLHTRGEALPNLPFYSLFIDIGEMGLRNEDMVEVCRSLKWKGNFVRSSSESSDDIPFIYLKLAEKGLFHKSESPSFVSIGNTPQARRVNLLKLLTSSEPHPFPPTLTTATTSTPQATTAQPVEEARPAASQSLDGSRVTFLSSLGNKTTAIITHKVSQRIFATSIKLFACCMSLSMLATNSFQAPYFFAVGVALGLLSPFTLALDQRPQSFAQTRGALKIYWVVKALSPELSMGQTVGKAMANFGIWTYQAIRVIIRAFYLLIVGVAIATSSSPHSAEIIVELFRITFNLLKLLVVKPEAFSSILAALFTGAMIYSLIEDVLGITLKREHFFPEIGTRRINIALRTPVRRY